MILSVDDGCASDARVAELAEKYKINAVFYWPVDWYSLAYANGYEPLSFSIAEEISMKHEIGSHGITHRHLTKMPVEEAKTEIAESLFMLEELFNTDIEKFAPSRGYTTPELTEYTLNLYESQRLTRGEGLVHIHPDSGANDNKPWRERITEDTTEIWCHSWELDKYNLWEGLEDFLRENKY